LHFKAFPYYVINTNITNLKTEREKRKKMARHYILEVGARNFTSGFEGFSGSAPLFFW
jgi:hypothetical protein